MAVPQNLNAILHRPGLRKLTDAGLNAYPALYPNFFEVTTSNKPWEEEAMWAGVGVPQKVESDVEVTPQMEASLGPPVRIRHSTYRGAYMFTKKAARDDRWNWLRKAASSMGEGMRELHELLAHELLNNAQSRIVGWDRKPLAATDHKLIGTSATYSNLFPASGPSYALLSEIRKYGLKMPDDRGFTRRAQNVKIFVPEEDVPIWEQYVKSSTDPTQQNPNVINPYQNVQVFGDPYLTAYTAVVIYDMPRSYWFNRFGPNTDTFNKDDPPALVHRIWWEGSQMIVDARNFAFIPKT